MRLKILSGTKKNSEIELTENKPIIIGRESGCDLYLNEDLISRRHAKVTLIGKKLLIEDLNSKNGIRLNNEKIKGIFEATVFDVIQIGMSLMVLIEDPRSKRVSQNNNNGIFSGRLGKIDLFEVVQLICKSKSNGILEVHDADNHGQIFFNDGAIYTACIEDSGLAPHKCLSRIVSWKEGIYFFREKLLDSDTSEPDIKEDVDTLLMNIAKESDEFGREYARNAIETLMINKNNENSFDLLSLEGGSIYSVIYELLLLKPLSVKLVLDKSTLTDLAAYRAILELESMGLVIKLE